jgi:hypothetical protein
MIFTTRINPRLKLSSVPPEALQGDTLAAAEWRRVMSLYGQSLIIFDAGLLLCYCQVFQEDQKLLIDLYVSCEKTIETLKATVHETTANISSEQFNKLQLQIRKAEANLTALAIRRRNKRKLLLMLAKSLLIEPPLTVGEI